MKRIDGIGLSDVQAVYAGPEGDLWEPVMGEQVHIGGLASSIDLAERAGIRGGQDCPGAFRGEEGRLRNVE